MIKVEFMEQNNWVEYKINVGARLKEFCLEILKFGDLLPEKVQSKSHPISTYKIGYFKVC